MSTACVPYICGAALVAGAFAGSSAFAEYHAGLGAQALAIVSSLTVLIGGILVSIYEFLVGGFECDDHCAGMGGWRDIPGAWQWSVFVWAGILGALLTLGIFLLACNGSYRRARIVTGVTFVIYATPLFL